MSQDMVINTTAWEYLCRSCISYLFTSAKEKVDKIQETTVTIPLVKYLNFLKIELFLFFKQSHRGLIASS